MTTATQALAPSENNLPQQAPTIFDPEAMQWSAQGHLLHNGFIQDTFCTPSLFNPNTACNQFTRLALNDIQYNANHALKYPVNYTSPRIFQNIDFASRPNDMAASYPPAAYFHSPPQLHSTPSLPDHSTSELSRLNDDWDLHYGVHIKHEDQRDYNSPYSDMSRASTPYSNGYEEEYPIDKEQPYAQLIHRALLDAPDHTMVLRDIYDWFRKHTDKATNSETKGWQNSIRHNLSMNGVSTGLLWPPAPSLLHHELPSSSSCSSQDSADTIRLSRKSILLPMRRSRGLCGALRRPHWSKV